MTFILTPETRNAFARARKVIDRRRANQIRQVRNWNNGMCGCLNAVRPVAEDAIPEENAAIHRLWETLPGHCCWFDALLMLCNQEKEETKR